MAKLEITNKTLRVIGAPQKDRDPIWLRLLKQPFIKVPTHQNEKTYRLSAYKSVGFDHAKTPFSAEWLLTNGLKPRDYWILSLSELHQNASEVIASRDEAVMRDVYTKLDTAMNADEPFRASVNIENSTVVVDSYVGRDAKTDVNEGDPPLRKQQRS